MPRKLINEHGNCDDFVVERTLYEYSVECFCGELWQWTTTTQKSSRYIADMMAEECWSLDENDTPQCTKCLRNLRMGMKPTDPRNLGEMQKEVLRSLRKFGMWSKHGGWVWDSPSKTKRVLESLVKRGLVEKDKKGTYTPV